MPKINRKRFFVRSANGRRPDRAVGIAGIAIILNIFTTAAAQSGTRSRRAASARRAVTNGNGRPAINAWAGRNTRNGMWNRANNRTSVYGSE